MFPMDTMVTFKLPGSSFLPQGAGKLKARQRTLTFASLFMLSHRLNRMKSLGSSGPRLLRHARSPGQLGKQIQRGKTLGQRDDGLHLTPSRRVIVTVLINAIALLVLVGCNSGSATTASHRDNITGELTVFAAASLAKVFPQVAEAFQRENPGVSVSFNFAGSQRLRTQLEFGARADVFASADQKQMDLAGNAGLLSGQAVSFATNRLVVIVPTASGRGSTTRTTIVQGLGDLAGDGVKLALALPEVPAGGYARVVLRNLEADIDALGPGYAGRVLANVVSLETNVRGVVQKVVLDEVDAGIVYWTDARAEFVANTLTVLPIPQGSNVPAVYPMAVLADSANPALAEAFLRFTLDETGQAILREHGFGPRVAAAVADQPAGPAGR